MWYLERHTRIVFFSVNRFTSKSFRRLLLEKRYTLTGTHTHLPTAKKGIKQAITPADFTVHALQCHGIASTLVCELKPTQHFGVTFWCVKQRSGRETLSRRSRNCPTTQNRSLAEPGTFLSWIITNYPVSSGKLIITPPTWFVTYWSRHYTCTYLILESLCKTMLSFSSILGSSPLYWSRFTAVLNHSSFEQLSRNAAVKAEKR